jgi:hypothetical protein
MKAIEDRLVGLHLSQLSLKGERDYLRGADLWTVLEAAIAPIVGDASARVAFTFRRLSRSQPRVVRIAECDPRKRWADLSIEAFGKRTDLAVSETDDAISLHEKCSEEEIVPEVKVHADHAEVPIAGPGSPIDRLVAATKLLHNERVGADIRWLIGRLSISCPFVARPEGVIKVRIVRRLPSNATSSEILIDGTAVGSIMFTPRPRG